MIINIAGVQPKMRGQKRKLFRLEGHALTAPTYALKLFTVQLLEISMLLVPLITVVLPRFSVKTCLPTPMGPLTVWMPAATSTETVLEPDLFIFVQMSIKKHLIRIWGLTG